MSLADSLVVIRPDPRACGLGRGEECCAFLVADGGGFACGRTIPGIETQVRARLAAGTMAAQYDPGDKPYPECQPAGLP